MAPTNNNRPAHPPAAHRLPISVDLLRRRHLALALAALIPAAASFTRSTSKRLPFSRRRAPASPLRSPHDPDLMSTQTIAAADRRRSLNPAGLLRHVPLLQAAPSLAVFPGIATAVCHRPARQADRAHSSPSCARNTTCCCRRSSTSSGPSSSVSSSPTSLSASPASSRPGVATYELVAQARHRVSSAPLPHAGRPVHIGGLSARPRSPSNSSSRSR